MAQKNHNKWKIVKRYFTSLFLALAGRSLFMEESVIRQIQEELLASRKELAGVNERAVRLENLLKDKIGKELAGYQRLVENLRERLNEKDVLIGRLKHDYQKRIEDYNVEIDRLARQSKDNQERYGSANENVQ